MRSHVSVLSTATETALAVGTASLSRQEQGARNPLVLPVKAYPPAQVSAPCWSNTRTAATTTRLFAVVFGTFFKTNKLYKYLSTFPSHVR